MKMSFASPRETESGRFRRLCLAVYHLACEAVFEGRVARYLAAAVAKIEDAGYDVDGFLAECRDRGGLGWDGFGEVVALLEGRKVVRT